MLFSSGKILQIKDDKMVHSSSTSSGSSGSPLIRRNRNRNELNYIVEIHFRTLKDYNYNLAASFDNILNDLKNKIIETSQIKIVAHIKIPESNYKARIICSCENAEKDYDFKLDNSMIKNEDEIKKCLIFIDKQKIDFAYYYTFPNPGNYEIIYIFHNLLNATNLMFYRCKEINDLDLSNFNTENVENMSMLFSDCSSLVELNISNFKTDKVKNMDEMFYGCLKLINLDITNFEFKNSCNMKYMFGACSQELKQKVKQQNPNLGEITFEEKINNTFFPQNFYNFSNYLINTFLEF